MIIAVKEIAENFAHVLRRIIGAPDYERYVEHMRSQHPAARMLSRSEFVDERMRDRYSRPGARCC